MLSAAKVEAKALAMGLKDGKKPLSDNAKAMATYQLILEQTAASPGCTSRAPPHGKANADRIRAAKSEEAFTKLGEVLMPLCPRGHAASCRPPRPRRSTRSPGSAGAVAPLVDGALKAISTAIDTIGDSFTALKQLV